MNIYQQNTHAHSVAWSTWHFEWCTKYRYKIFRKDYLKNLCLISIQEAAKKNNMNILEMEVDVDHVHMVVSIPLTMAPSKALNLIKGFSAYFLFKLVPNLRKRYKKGHLWSKGKFMARAGHITLENAKKYLEEHHTKSMNYIYLTREAPPFRV